MKMMMKQPPKRDVSSGSNKSSMSQDRSVVMVSLPGAHDGGAATDLRRYAADRMRHFNRAR